MTLRLATSTLRRTVAATRAPTLRIAAPRTLHSSAILPKAPRGNEDQGPSGPNQTTNNASGPSGTAPDAQLSDPYPLPFSPDVVDLNNANSGPESGPQSKWAGLNLASDRQTLDGVDAPMRVPGREDEDRDTKVARLVYQCRKRGTLETDLLLSTFAKKELKNLPMEELDEFDRVRSLLLLLSAPSPFSSSPSLDPHPPPLPPSHPRSEPQGSSSTKNMESTPTDPLPSDSWTWQLLDEPDWDIFYWCTQRKPIPERWADSFKTEGKLGHRLIVHTRNEEKAVRWMPEL